VWLTAIEHDSLVHKASHGVRNCGSSPAQLNGNIALIMWINSSDADCPIVRQCLALEAVSLPHQSVSLVFGVRGAFQFDLLFATVGANVFCERDGGHVGQLVIESRLSVLSIIIMGIIKPHPWVSQKSGQKSSAVF
jgi:hypothetical protein